VRDLILTSPSPPLAQNDTFYCACNLHPIRLLTLHRKITTSEVLFKFNVVLGSNGRV
jgi:hypothetical protein